MGYFDWRDALEPVSFLSMWDKQWVWTLFIYPLEVRARILSVSFQIHLVHFHLSKTNIILNNYLKSNDSLRDFISLN